MLSNCQKCSYLIFYVELCTLVLPPFCPMSYLIWRLKRLVSKNKNILVRRFTYFDDRHCLLPCKMFILYRLFSILIVEISEILNEDILVFTVNDPQCISKEMLVSNVLFLSFALRIFIQFRRLQYKEVLLFQYSLVALS